MHLYEQVKIPIPSTKTFTVSEVRYLVALLDEESVTFHPEKTTSYEVGFEALVATEFNEIFYQTTSTP